MKNAMLIVSVLCLTTGCETPSATSDGVSTLGGVSTSAALASVATSGCAATQNVGSVTINCADGSSATIINGPAGTNGTNGTNGTAGVKGATGSTGTSGTNGTNGLVGSTGTNGTNGTAGTNGTNGVDAVNARVLDRNSVQLGSKLLSHSGLGGTGNRGLVHVLDTSDYTTAEYDLGTGLLSRRNIYYTSANCTGTDLVDRFAPTGSTLNNGGTVYRVNESYFQATINSYKDATGACFTSNSGGTAPNDWFSVTVVYSNGNIPASITLPLRIKQ